MTDAAAVASGSAVPGAAASGAAGTDPVGGGTVASGVMGAGVVGVGTDLVEVQRLRDALDRQPSLADRLFTTGERSYAERHRDPAPHLAARFAAKEAVMKALGAGMSQIGFDEIEVTRDDAGRPGVALHGRADAIATSAGVGAWHLSLTHTTAMAQAVAVASAAGAPGPPEEGTLGV